jgi:hypothetical protein
LDEYVNGRDRRWKRCRTWQYDGDGGAQGQRSGYLHPIYKCVLFPQAITAWPGNAIPIPDPRAIHLAIEPEVSVEALEGRKRIVVEPACASLCFIVASLGLLAFGIGWFFDWLTALETEA